MTLQSCLTAAQHIHSLGATPNYRHLYERTKLAKWLQGRVDEFSMLERQAVTDCGGSIDGTKIHFPGTKEEAEAKMARFITAKEEIGAIEVEAPTKLAVTEADLNGTALSSETVIALEPFIDFEFMRDNDGNSGQG